MRLVLKKKVCPKCGGTGMADSGGTTPWGWPIEIPCDCQEPEKRCIKCDEAKPLSEFHRSSVASTDGYRNVCKCCRRKTEAARIREKRSQ